MPRSPCWTLKFLQSLLVAVHVPGVCLAQSSVQVATASPTPSVQPSSTTSAPAQTHTVQVGLADHKFRPDTTVASVGDVVEFAFYPLNHSVVRAEYGFPCIPYEMTGPSKTGFFSGFYPVDKILSSPPTYRIVINDTNPIFFYCSAPGSCLTYGMVGAINPNASATVQKQQQLALNSTYMLNPGEPFPAESPSPGSPPSSTSTSSSGTGNSNENKIGLSKRAIIAMAVTGACIAVLAALLFFCWGRTKTLKDEMKRKASMMRRPDGNPTGDMSMLTPRAELGDTETENAVHPVYRHQYHHSLATDDGTTYQQHQYQQYAPHAAYSPVPQMPPYFPPPPPSSPSPLMTPAHPHSPHPHPHIQPSSPIIPSKCEITSPIGPHPAYTSLEYYQHQYHRQQQQYHTSIQPAICHELSSTGDAPTHKSETGKTENGTTTSADAETKSAQHQAPKAATDTATTNSNEDAIESAPSYSDSVDAPRPTPLETRCAGVVEKNGGSSEG